MLQKRVRGLSLYPFLLGGYRNGKLLDPLMRGASFIRIDRG